MTKRTNIIAFPLLAICGGLVWLLGTDDIKGIGEVDGQAMAPPALAAQGRPVTSVETVVPVWTASAVAVKPNNVASPTTQAAAPAPAEPVPSADDVTLFSAPGGGLAYTARPNDTLSELTAALYGTNSRANRDAVVDANPSLQTDPDHVAIGQDYNSKAPRDDRPAGRAAPTPAAPTPVALAAAGPVTEMRYTAGPGDTVTGLAEAFFGSGTRAGRDAVTDANPSLRRNPDRLTAGTTYRIVTPAGLSAAAAPVAADGKSPSRSGPQPDADDVLRDGSGRALRYTARAGDTVTSLAIALLGSDTKANQDAIRNANAPLKADPDCVVVGQTYWIPAPAAGAY